MPAPYIPSPNTLQVPKSAPAAAAAVGMAAMAIEPNGLVLPINHQPGLMNVLADHFTGLTMFPDPQPATSGSNMAVRAAPGQFYVDAVGNLLFYNGQSWKMVTLVPIP